MKQPDIYTQIVLYMFNGFSLYDAILKELRLTCSIPYLSHVRKELYKQYPYDHDSVDRAIDRRHKEITLAYK